jgi:hypothetical protein
MVNVGTVAAALAGYLFTYYNSKLSKEREAQIDRVNAQVKSLYGPLLACLTTSRSAFDAMLKQHSPDGSRKSLVAAIHENPGCHEGEAYRKWMTEVLQPLNERVAEIVTKNADLLEAAAMEPLLLQLVAHVSAYRVIIKRWEEGHIEEWSQISFPDGIVEWAESEFRRVKAKQARLLGMHSPEQQVAEQAQSAVQSKL